MLPIVAVQHERGPRTSTIRKQVALYFRGHKEVNGSAAHFPGSSLPGPPFFTTVAQLEPHNLDLSTVASTPERQTIVGLAQPTPKVCFPHIYASEFQMQATKSQFVFFNVPNVTITITFSQGPEAEILVQNSSPAIKFLTANPQPASITVRLKAVSFYLVIFSQNLTTLFKFLHKFGVAFHSSSTPMKSAALPCTSTRWRRSLCASLRLASFS